jgi:hypothetical protein
MQVSTALKRQRVAAMAASNAGIARVDVSQLWTPPGLAASGGKPKPGALVARHGLATSDGFHAGVWLAGHFFFQGALKF